MAKGPSAWITHLKSWTATKSKSNPSYTYRDAMKDPAARAEYKKHHGTASSPSKKGKKMRGGSGYGASLANAASVNDSGLLLGGDDMASAPAKGADVPAAQAPAAQAPAAQAPTAQAQSGGRKSRRRKGTKSKKSRKTKSKKRKSRSSRK